MNIEIELKFSLSESDQKLFEAWLDEHAQFVKGVLHNEMYLNNPKNTFKFTDSEGYVDSLDYLRVRFTQDGDSVCLKHFYEDPEKPGHTSYCDEYEFKVSNGKTTLQMFEALGYTDNVELQKLRKVYTYKDFEIVVDDVKDLRVFIEIETKSTFEDPKQARQAIIDLIKEIGISNIRVHRRGYTSMIINEGYDFGEEEQL